MISPILSGILSAVSAVAGLLVYVSEVRNREHTKTRPERVMAAVLLAIAAVIGGVAAYQTLPGEVVTKTDTDVTFAPETDFTATVVPQPPTKTETETTTREERPVVRATDVRVVDRKGESQADLAGAIRAALPPSLRTGAKVTGRLTETCGRDESFDMTTCRVQLRVTIDKDGALDGFTLSTRGGGIRAEDASEQARGRLITQIHEHFANKDATP